MSLNNYCKEIYIKSFDQLQKYSKQYIKPISKEQWIFRGISDPKYDLIPSLEREVCLDTLNMGELNKINKRKYALKNGIEGNTVKEIEIGILRRFMRQYHLFEHREPEKTYMEWFSIMQHYQAPTRLLDWTYSFFIAMFFALNSQKKESAIWAFENSYSWISKRIEKIFMDNGIEEQTWKMIYEDQNTRQRINFEKIFMNDKDIKFVYPMNPFYLNERLIIQQGVFLCPGSISVPFESNLEEMICKYKKGKKLRKYIISMTKDELKRTMTWLFRMNITEATLYPGLEGFSKSLKGLLHESKILVPAYIKGATDYTGFLWPDNYKDCAQKEG